MSSFGDRIDTASLTPISWVAITMALVSAFVHLYIAVDVLLPSTLGLSFLLATGGFVGGVGLVLLNYRRRLVYLLGIPFTGSQIVLWYLLNQPAGVGDIPTIDFIDKIAQTVLIGCLVALSLREP